MINAFPSSGTNRSHLDWTIIICWLALILFGWVNIYASIHTGDIGSITDFSSRAGKQAIWILTAITIGAVIIFAINAQFWEVMSPLMYGVVLVLLIAVIFIGGSIKGSHSWFTLGPVSFQPAELSKITTSLLLASIMGHTGYRMDRRKDFLLTAACIVLPMLIIVAEQETGSALVYLGFIFVLYREGLSGWLLAFIALVIVLFILTITVNPYVSIVVLLGIVSFIYKLNEGKGKLWLVTEGLFVVFLSFLPKLEALLLAKTGVSLPKPTTLLLLAFAVSVPFYIIRAYRKGRISIGVALAAAVVGIALIFSSDFIFNDVLQPHQRQRIEVLLGMKDDPSGVGYNVLQSKIAIGAGGFWGKGYLNGTQTAYGFVPEQSTDFIFCTVGEEWGFVGCFAVILLYVILIWRIINDAESSRSAFTRIYGYCVASIIFMHLFINIGMTIGLMPVIGIPLPMLSYGGSSLWSFTALIFIFLALDRQEKKYF